MSRTITKVIQDNKIFSVRTDNYYSSTQIQNDIEVTPTLTPLQSFIKLIPKNSEYLTYYKPLPSTDLAKIYNSLFLTLYKNITKSFFNSYTNSIFLKTKEELGTTFSGIQLLENLNFLGLVDVQGLKDEIFNNFKNDTCLVMDTEPDPDMHPMRLQIVKGNFYLSCRTHIVDFQFRNILNTSVFDNKEFYKNDNSYVNYCYQTYIERLQTLSFEYYNNILDLLYKDLKKLLENGVDIIDPITGISFVSTTQQEDAKKYMQFLFNTQFVFMCDQFNEFLSQQITNNNVTITLSNLQTVKDYFINNINQINREFQVVSNEFNLLYNITKDMVNNLTKVTVSLVTRDIINPNIISFITTSEIQIDGLYNTYSDLPEDTVIQLKQLIINSSTFNLLFGFVFPLNKILNFTNITQILLCSSTNENVNLNFQPAFKTNETIHNTATDKLDNCQVEDFNFTLGFDIEIAKLIAQTPITILKSLEETYDPNIAIAYRLKQAAEAIGAPDISIIPYSAPLLLPPPITPAPIPLIPPWGFIYWGISAGETAANWAKSGFGGGIGLGDTSSSYNFKNPFKPQC